MRITLLMIAFAAMFGSGAAAQTAIIHANLIDGTGAAAAARRHHRHGGRPHQRHRPVGAGGGSCRRSVVDAAGKFVVPGIINAHGHVGPPPRDPQLRQYALYGVTTTTSMYFDQDDIVAFKAAQRAGDLRGARILTVKYRFMSPPFIPGSETKTPEEGRAKVDEIVAHGADFVKVWIDGQNGKYPKLTREFCAAVLDQARKHGKITMAHIFEYEDAKMIVDEGVNILAHNVRDAVIDGRLHRQAQGAQRHGDLDARPRGGDVRLCGRARLHRHAVLPEGPVGGAARAAAHAKARRADATIPRSRRTAAPSRSTRST